MPDAIYFMADFTTGAAVTMVDQLAAWTLLCEAK
jgi:hypothetical protein